MPPEWVVARLCPVRGRVAWSLGGLLVLAAAAVALRLVVGEPGLPLEEVLPLRAGRAAVGVIVGVCLAVAGVMLQSLLRNPLASPDILGLASGASLAVLLAVYVLRDPGGEGGRVAAAAWHSGPALVGSLLALGAVYLMGQRGGLIDPPSLILTGVVVGIMCSAGVMLVQHLMPDRGMASVRLLIGSISDDVSPAAVWMGGGIAVLGTVVGVVCGRAMDAAALGDDEARAVGVRLDALRGVLLVGAGIMTAAAVVLAGPVGFVGLVCPHAARLLTGMRGGHAALVVGAGLAGAAVVVGADAAVRLAPLGSGRLPLGVLTALLGGPAFIALLRRERGG